MSSLVILITLFLSLFAGVNLMILVVATTDFEVDNALTRNAANETLRATMSTTKMRWRAHQITGNDHNDNLLTAVGTAAPAASTNTAGEGVLEAFIAQSLQNLNTMEIKLSAGREEEPVEERFISTRRSDFWNTDGQESNSTQEWSVDKHVVNETSSSLLSAQGIWEEDMDMQIELERRLSADRYGWRKFNVVVGYSNPLKVPAQTPLAPGDLYVADEYVFNTKQNDNIGRMYQRCILMPIEPANALLSVWECVWEFDLKLKSAQPGKLALQGPWFFDENGFLDEQDLGINPLYPSKQYVVINGGTGAFTGVYGVARIKPLDLLAVPPSLCYTFYLQLG